MFVAVKFFWMNRDFLGKILILAVLGGWLCILVVMAIGAPPALAFYVPISALFFGCWLRAMVKAYKHFAEATTEILTDIILNKMGQAREGEEEATGFSVDILALDPNTYLAYVSSEDACTADSSSAVDHFNRALDYESRGEHDNAIAEYARAIELDSNYALAYFSRGSLLMLQGKKADAIAAFERVIALSDSAELTRLAKHRINELTKEA